MVVYSLLLLSYCCQIGRWSELSHCLVWWSSCNNPSMPFGGLCRGQSAIIWSSVWTLPHSHSALEDIDSISACLLQSDPLQSTRRLSRTAASLVSPLLGKSSDGDGMAWCRVEVPWDQSFYWSILALWCIDFGPQKCLHLATAIEYWSPKNL